MTPKFLKHYRQYAGLSEAEVNAEKRAEAEARKASALERVEPLDLSRTTWPEYPPSRVVYAVTFAARRGLHRYTDRRASDLRSALAARHGLAPGRVVVGPGAAALLSAAAAALLEPGDELITPWPSYGLYPLMARRARAAAVPVSGSSVERVVAAVGERTRVVVVCNPNDPTGELLEVDALRSLLTQLPDRVVVLLDEALRDYAVGEDVDAALELVHEFPRLLVVRTFSKAWGLAGLRVGYAVGGPGSEELLQTLGPELGLDELAQAGALEALTGSPSLAASRGAAVAAQRAALSALVRERPGFFAAPSQANVLWLRRDGLSADGLAGALRAGGVVVAGGGALVGDAAHVRMTVPHRPEGLERVRRALDVAGQLASPAAAPLRPGDVVSGG